MTYEQILKTAHELNEKFPGIVFSGSFGLALHGIMIREDFHDLDVQYPTELLGLEFSSERSAGADEVYQLNGINIDRFAQVDEPVKLLNGLNVLKPSDIWKYKAKFAAGTIPSARKHLNDILIHISAGKYQLPKEKEPASDEIPF